MTLHVAVLDLEASHTSGINAIHECLRALRRVPRCSLLAAPQAGKHLKGFYFSALLSLALVSSPK